MLKILWEGGEIAPEEQFLLLSTIFSYLMLDFYVKTRIRFSLRDKRLFEITEVEITRVDCISKFMLTLTCGLECDWYCVKLANAPMQRSSADTRIINKCYSFTKRSLIQESCYPKKCTSIHLTVVHIRFWLVGWFGV